MAELKNLSEIQRSKMARYSHFVVADKNDQAFVNQEIREPKFDKSDTMIRRGNCIDNIIVSRHILEQTPDIKRAVSILTSFILCPSGSPNASVVLYYGDELASSAEYDCVRDVLKLIEDRFVKEANLEENLYADVYKILSETGAKVSVILPDSSLDQIINAQFKKAQTVSLQSIQTDRLIDLSTGTFRSLGFLKNPERDGNQYDSTLQSAFTDSSIVNKYDPYMFNEGTSGTNKLLLSFTDNIDILKVPGIESYNHAIRTSTTLQNLTNRSNGLDPNITLKRDYKVRSTIFLDTPEKLSNEHTSLKIDYPTECVIPVRDVSSGKVVSYLLLHDGRGAPLRAYYQEDIFNEILRSNSNTSNGNDSTGTTSLSSKQTKILNISEFTTRNQNDVQNADRALFCNALRNELLSRINGKRVNKNYKGNFELLVDDDVLTVALSRAMQHQRTQFLYVPAQLVNYQAYHYDEYGMGMSVVATTKLMSNLRAVLWMANYLRGLEQAIDSKRLNITVDPKDANPNKSVERIVNTYIAMNATRIPGLLTNRYNFSDMVGSLQKNRLGINITNASECAGIPAEKVELEHIRKDRAQIDRELQDDVKAQALQGIGGISPSMVDNSYQVQFSAEVIRENTITNRIVTDYQNQTSNNISDGMKKEATFDGTFISQALELLKITPKIKKELGDVIPHGANDEDIKRIWLEQIIAKASLRIPLSNEQSFDQTLEKLKSFSDFVDTMLKDIESTDFSGWFDDDENLRDIARDLGRSRAALIKKSLLRTYIETTKGVPDYLLTIFDPEDNNKICIEEFDKLLESLDGTSEMMGKVVKFGNKLKEETEKVRAELAPVEPEEEPTEEPVAEPIGESDEGTGDDENLGLDLGDEGGAEEETEEGEGTGEPTTEEGEGGESDNISDDDLTI